MIPIVFGVAAVAAAPSAPPTRATSPAAPADAARDAPPGSPSRGASDGRDHGAGDTSPEGDAATSPAARTDDARDPVRARAARDGAASTDDGHARASGVTPRAARDGAGSPPASTDDASGATAAPLTVENTGDLSPLPAARFARGVVRPDGRRHLVALTFDDGPSIATTPAILDELARRHLRATFFVNAYRFVGRSARAAAHRALLRDERARAHDVGNHTYDHPLLSDLPPARQVAEIRDGEAHIARVLGERPTLFRPPFGRMTATAHRVVDESGATTVLWNISSDDPYRRRAESVVAHVMDELRRRGGGVVLLHDTHPWTVRALPLLLDAIDAEGCRRVARGEAPYLVVPLDRFWHPRYPSRLDDEGVGRRAASEGRSQDETEDDVTARRRITAACRAGAASPATAVPAPTTTTHATTHRPKRPSEAKEPP